MTRRRSIIVVRVFLALTGIALIVIVIGGLVSGEHGVRRRYLGDNGISKTHRTWPFIYLDGADFRLEYLNEGANRVEFMGFVATNGSNLTEWRIEHNGNADVTVNGRQVVTMGQYSREPLTEAFSVVWSEPSIPVQVTIDLVPPLIERSQSFAIYERTALGWNLIPTHRLYRRAPDSATVEYENALNAIIAAAGFIFVTGIVATTTLLLILIPNWQRRSTWLIAGVVVLGLAVRLLVLADRAAGDPYFSFLQPGTDNYPLLARTTLGGESFLSGAYYNPGMIAWMVLVTRVIGPSLGLSYLLHAAAAAASIGLLVVTSRRMFGESVALVAGSLLAIYPPLVFFQTTVQIEALLPTVFTLVVCAALWAIRARNGQAAVCFGLTVGLATLLRANSVALFFALPLTLLVVETRARALRLTTVAAIGVVAVIVPQTLANAVAGSYAVVSSNGAVNLYYGNNRDTDGGNLPQHDQAFLSVNQTDQQYLDAFFQDLASDPIRMAELQVRKVGLFLGSVEAANNVDFYSQGASLSLWLQFPINFMVLVVLAVSGLFLAWRRREFGVEWKFLALAAVLVMAAVVAFSVSSRFRIPVVGLLVLPAAYWIVHAVNGLLGRGFPWQPVRALLTATLSVGVMIFLSTVLPVKRFWTGELPPNAIASQIRFDDVTLFGYSVDRISPVADGFVYLTLYWRLEHATSTDHTAFVHLTRPDGERLTGVDRTLGGVAYPTVPTSQWPAGTELRESLFLKIPSDAPSVIAVAVGIYGHRASPLFHLSLSDSYAIQSQTPCSDCQEIHVEFAAKLRLAEARVDLDGQEVRVANQWVRFEPIYEDFMQFIHVIDDTGTIVAQVDDKYLGGTYTTSSLPLDVSVTVESRVTLLGNTKPGHYRVLTGLYRVPWNSRVPAFNVAGTRLPDDAIEVGSFEIR